MANTYTAIATTTVTAASVTDITFSSIPQTYTDLRLLVSLRSSVNFTYGGGTFNFNGGGQGSVYDSTRLIGSGSGVGTNADNNLTYNGMAINNGNTTTASMFTIIDWYIPSYTNSTNKSWTSMFAMENNATEAYVGGYIGQMRNTSAITSIKIFDTTGGMGDILQHSTATLYGIKNS